MIYNNFGYVYHSMEQQTVQKIMLDSCVVIDLMEKKGFANRLRSSLRGKSVQIVLYDVVLHEVERVRGLDFQEVISSISKIVRRDVIVCSVDEAQKSLAESTTTQYQFCHRGDNLILATCSMKSFILLTCDRMLLWACEVMGVAAFHPARAGNI